MPPLVARICASATPSIGPPSTRWSNVSTAAGSRVSSVRARALSNARSATIAGGGLFPTRWVTTIRMTPASTRFTSNVAELGSRLWASSRWRTSWRPSDRASMAALVAWTRLCGAPARSWGTRWATAPRGVACADSVAVATAVGQPPASNRRSTSRARRLLPAPASPSTKYAGQPDSIAVATESTSS